MKNRNFKKVMSVFLSVLMILSFWVWMMPADIAATVEEGSSEIMVGYETECDHEGTGRQLKTYVNDRTHVMFCTECGKNVDEAVACTYSENLIKETCSEYVYACIECGYSYTEERAEVEHKWTDWLYNSDSCLSAVTRTKKCTSCLLEETEIYKDEDGNAIFGNHTLVVVEGKKATCTRDGMTDYTRCVTCGKVSESKVIPAYKHPDDDDDGNCDICDYMVDASKGVCTCLCHDDSFLGNLIHKIAVFLWKLLKMNYTCACGINHW